MNTSTRLTNTDRRNRTLSSDVTIPRERTQDTAQRLSLVAMRSWEKALTGIVAFPAAIALTTAANVLFGVSLLERTFELIESTLVDMGHRVGEEFDAHGEPRDGWRRDEKDVPRSS